MLASSSSQWAGCHICWLSPLERGDRFGRPVQLDERGQLFASLQLLELVEPLQLFLRICMSDAMVNIAEHESQGLT